MHAQRKDRRGDWIPVMVAAFVAIVGQTIILFNDFAPDNNSHGGGGRTGMITTAAVSRAGATEISSGSASVRPISYTWLASTLLRGS
jgi:hypothetical protein